MPPRLEDEPTAGGAFKSRKSGVQFWRSAVDKPLERAAALEIKNGVRRTTLIASENSVKNTIGHLLPHGDVTASSWSSGEMEDGYREARLPISGAAAAQKLRGKSAPW
jgi:hypothetical protein